MSEWKRLGFTRCKFKHKKPQTPIVNGQCYAAGIAMDFCQRGLFKEALTSNQVADAIKMIKVNKNCGSENVIGTNDISSVELCFFICNTLYNFTYAAVNG